jgi:hypothetical protein
MGIIEIHSSQLVIFSHLIIYGEASDETITDRIREEIDSMWNEPDAVVPIDGRDYRIVFRISAELKKDITELEVLQNTDPRNNYFRIEAYAHGNISFVDGLGCNTGYFKLENLYEGSTTAAHEYGHTLGLEHPKDLDYRGKGVPGIMYPRGTLVDPEFQYEPSTPAGQPGGTLFPKYRKVLKQDIMNLKLQKIAFENRQGIIGEFSNVFHWRHDENNFGDFTEPPVRG